MKSRKLTDWEISRLEKGIALLEILGLLEAPDLLEAFKSVYKIRVFFKGSKP